VRRIFAAVHAAVLIAETSATFRETSGTTHQWEAQQSTFIVVVRVATTIVVIIIATAVPPTATVAAVIASAVVVVATATIAAVVVAVAFRSLPFSPPRALCSSIPCHSRDCLVGNQASSWFLELLAS